MGNSIKGMLWWVPEGERRLTLGLVWPRKRHNLPGSRTTVEGKPNLLLEL